MLHTIDPALHALNRFGLGARPGEVRRLGDPRAWLEGQLTGDPPELSGATELPTARQVGTILQTLRRVQQGNDPDMLDQARSQIREVLATEVGAVLTERVASERPFVERLVAFWSNHLCVSVTAKLAVAPLAGLYEREAIRPHVLGRFEDLVLASARHPAMLLYLDNAQSVGPRSTAGRITARRGEGRGLNENYARELLELHTLGVDGGYGQGDVGELARVLTGWTVAGLGGPRRLRQMSSSSGTPEFRFLELIHEPGTKTVLGQRYRQGGAAQGEAAIRDLCRHPSTARFVAGKLVRHFVADDPPATAVDRVAAVFSETGGDLRAVARSLVRLDAAWDPERGCGRKLRTPQDWLVAALRAFDAREAPPALGFVLIQLRHALWAPAAPKGYGDVRSEWADPDSLMNRAELARTIAERVIERVSASPRGRSFDPARLLDTVQPADGSPLPDLLADRAIPSRERVALLLGGPDFQWR